MTLGQIFDVALQLKSLEILALNRQNNCVHIYPMSMWYGTRAVVDGESRTTEFPLEEEQLMLPARATAFETFFKGP